MRLIQSGLSPHLFDLVEFRSPSDACYACSRGYTDKLNTNSRTDENLPSCLRWSSSFASL